MKYDAVVIGSGPGGYVCAIRAAQLGLKVAIVEKRSTYGGTCLNIGCIPSKAMLHTSELYFESSKMAKMGVKFEGVSLDLAAMMAHKNSVVDSNVKGIAFLLKKNGIDAYTGTGSIAISGSNKAVRVLSDDGASQDLETTNIVIATGSDSFSLPGIDIDEQQIVSSTGALEFSEVPNKFVVIGAGVIGLELGSVWSRLGSEVTVIEYLPRILPGIDGESAKLLQRSLSKQGIKFKLSHSVSSVEKQKDGSCKVFASKVGKEGDSIAFAADKVLVSIGRKPYTDGLGLEEAAIAMGGKGKIAVDATFLTNVAGVYAIGDVIDGPMLAHKAEEDGVAVAENIAGLHGHVDYSTVASVVYTEPELASIGYTEEDLKEKGIEYKVGKFPFSANGRAKAIGAADGQVKMLADANTDRILGAHIVGKGAGDLLQEVVTAINFKASSEDIALTCHAHPTMSEAVREAALAVNGKAIHI